MSHTGGLRFRTRPTSLWCIAILVLAAMFELADVPVWAQTSQKHVLVLYATRRDAQIALIGDRDIPRILDAASGASDPQQNVRGAALWRGTSRS